MNRKRETNDLEMVTGKRLRLISSLVFGTAAVWYSWLRYTNLTNRVDVNWYEWIHPLMALLAGSLCLWATVLFVLRNPSGLPVFRLGLSLVPLLLFVNLMILIFRVIVNIFQGNAGFFFDRVLNQPHKAVLVPLIVIALMLLGSLSKTESDPKSNGSGGAS